MSVSNKKSRGILQAKNTRKNQEKQKFFDGRKDLLMDHKTVGPILMNFRSIILHTYKEGATYLSSTYMVKWVSRGCFLSMNT